MNKERIAYLLGRYSERQLTEEEENEFSTLLFDPSCEEAIKEVLDAHANKQQKTDSLSAERQARILAAVRQHEPYAAPVILMRKKRVRWMPAAAAAVLLLAASLFFLSKLGNNNEKKHTASQPAHRIEPGGNKAILSLANGEVIKLDTVGNGVLAQQGAATVIKLSDGQLTYNGTGEQPGQITFNTLTTPRGGQYMLVLQDGTKVWLNAETHLRFPTAFAGKNREVELSGEAYFEVAKNDRQPFVVTVNNISQVQVLGTHFNVMGYKEEARMVTTLLEGSVKVSASDAPGKDMILMPGQQALYNNDGVFSVNHNADTEQAVAWKNGKLFFHNQDIRTIMRQVSRWYNVDVEINGNIDDTYTINVDRDVPIEKLLKYIELSGGVHFKIKGQKIMVSPQ